jgi:uncharacterized protein YicC (UPF0701 family)
MWNEPIKSLQELKGIFTVDDIHNIRVEMADERRSMTPEAYKEKRLQESERFKKRLDEMRVAGMKSATEKIREQVQNVE